MDKRTSSCDDISLESARFLRTCKFYIFEWCWGVGVADRESAIISQTIIHFFHQKKKRRGHTLSLPTQGARKTEPSQWEKKVGVARMSKILEIVLRISVFSNKLLYYVYTKTGNISFRKYLNAYKLKKNWAIPEAGGPCTTTPQAPFSACAGYSLETGPTLFLGPGSHKWNKEESKLLQRPRKKNFEEISVVFRDTPTPPPSPQLNYPTKGAARNESDIN